MAKWVEDTNGDLINLDLVRIAQAVQSGSDWIVRLYLVASFTDLANTFASQQDARDFAKKLFQPFDLSVL